MGKILSLGQTLVPKNLDEGGGRQFSSNFLVEALEFSVLTEKEIGKKREE